MFRPTAMPPTKYEQPDSTRPLAEPTLNRRVWACYLARGMTRADWARAMDVAYNLASHWDHGRVNMSLVHLVRAKQLLGRTLDELVFGEVASAGAGTPPPESSLSPHEVSRVLDDVRASRDEVDALERYHVKHPLQRLTRTFVTQYVETYRASVDAGEMTAVARQRALDAAAYARDQVDAMSAGVRPIDGERLRVDTAVVLAAATTSAPKKLRKPRKKTARIEAARATIARR